MAGTFHFLCVDSKVKNVLSDPVVGELLKKWSMKTFLRIQRYTFDEPFQLYQKQDFAEAFFTDPNVVASLEGFSTGCAAPIGREAVSVSVQRVPCTLTSTALFRRLGRVGAVRGEAGAEDLIAPCAETQVGDIIINDRLRKILLDEADEDWDIFEHSERSEFLFQLLRLLVIGGRWCQYEDRITPYLDTARAIYKDLVSVVKDADGAITVRTVILKVVGKDEAGNSIIPLDPDHPQEVLFMCIDPVRRTVAVLSHHYGHGFYE